MPVLPLRKGPKGGGSTEPFASSVLHSHCSLQPVTDREGQRTTGAIFRIIVRLVSFVTKPFQTSQGRWGCVGSKFKRHK